MSTIFSGQGKCRVRRFGNVHPSSMESNLSVTLPITILQRVRGDCRAFRTSPFKNRFESVSSSSDGWAYAHEEPNGRWGVRCLNFGNSGFQKYENQLPRGRCLPVIASTSMSVCHIHLQYNYLHNLTSYHQLWNFWMTTVATSVFDPLEATGGTERKDDNDLTLARKSHFFLSTCKSAHFSFFSACAVGQTSSIDAARQQRTRHWEDKSTLHTASMAELYYPSARGLWSITSAFPTIYTPNL